MGRPAPFRPRRGKPYRTRKGRDCQHDIDYKTLVDVPCAWNNCVDQVCPICRKSTGGFGMMACPCDIMSAWKRPFMEQKNKPHPPIKVAGRRADRIRNSRRAHDKGEAYFRRINALLGQPVD